MKIFILVLVFSFVGTSVAADAPFGWRRDGTGTYPDADPPTEWGPEKNVVWKTPLAKWSNASPALAKDRLFVCAEPTTLVAVSLADGKILWEKTNTYDDILPSAEAEIFRADDAKAGEVSKKIKQQQREVEKAAKGLKEKPDDENLKKASEAAQADLAKLKEELTPLEKHMTPATNGVNGYSSCTPVTDGERVWVIFGKSTVACYDLEGDRKWGRLVERTKQKDGWGLCASPVLWNGNLLFHVNGITALDAKTGETRWEISSKPNWGSPLVVKVGDSDALVSGRGELVRLSDGKLIAQKLFSVNYCSPLFAEGTLFVMNEGNGKGLRLPDKIEADAKPQVLWQAKLTGKRYYSSPLCHDGILYALDQEGVLSVIDAKTGAALYEKDLGFGKGTSYPSLTLAGGKIYASHDNGTTVVFAPGREYKEIARNTLEPFRSCPVFRGTRMYIRGLKNLYCIGK